MSGTVGRECVITIRPIGWIARQRAKIENLLLLCRPYTGRGMEGTYYGYGEGVRGKKQTVTRNWVVLHCE